jgi:hypothetical protein
MARTKTTPRNAPGASCPARRRLRMSDFGRKVDLVPATAIVSKEHAPQAAIDCNASSDRGAPGSVCGGAYQELSGLLPSVTEQRSDL